MHLVSWETLKIPLSEGGLQIRDPGLENLALGEKIIRKMFAEKNHPVSKILWRNNLKGGSMRNLKSANTPSNTAIWNFCRRGIEHIQHQLYRIPSNGMIILLREDNILGNPPLSSLNPLNEIKSWLINKGLLRLADICSLDSNRNWVGWSRLSSGDSRASSSSVEIVDFSSFWIGSCPSLF